MTTWTRPACHFSPKSYPSLRHPSLFAVSPHSVPSRPLTTVLRISPRGSSHFAGIFDQSPSNNHLIPSHTTRPLIGRHNFPRPHGPVSREVAPGDVHDDEGGQHAAEQDELVLRGSPLRQSHHGVGHAQRVCEVEHAAARALQHTALVPQVGEHGGPHVEEVVHATVRALWTGSMVR